LYANSEAKTANFNLALVFAVCPRRWWQQQLFSCSSLGRPAGSLAAAEDKTPKQSASRASCSGVSRSSCTKNVIFYFEPPWEFQSFILHRVLMIFWYQIDATDP
jgi:hypothetical protein